jgi:DNA-directed RNA polymerase II subunit RPB7
MQDKIQDKLYADVEGTCSGRYGYVVTVVSVSRLEKGKVLPGSGLAEFKVSYQAILFKPFKGEVLDGLVTTVNKVKKQRQVLKLELRIINTKKRWDSLLM